jgi:hypothetical protein
MIVRFELVQIAPSTDDTVYARLEDTPMGYSGKGINIRPTGNYLVGNSDSYRDVLKNGRLSYDGEGLTGDQSTTNANNAKLISHLNSGGTITYIQKDANGYRLMGEFKGAL